VLEAATRSGGAPFFLMFRKRDTKIHFVGIGGIGMSGIAEVLLNLGYGVTGSDLAESETTKRLRGLGATIEIGHARENVGDTDVVVVSSAVKSDNPEVIAARDARIPVIARAEMLAELMRLKSGVLIAGSHGKTTTTSMIANDLHAAGMDPTVVIGGKVNRFDSNARVGYSDIFVAEADESDGSFLMLTPTWAVITNIDDEHLDHYGTHEGLLAAFAGFANRVPFYGSAVVCTDDPNVRTILPRINKQVVTYGLTGPADYVATELEHDGPSTRFRVFRRGVDRGYFSIRMPGRHNVQNALAALAISDLLQVHVEVTRKTLADFCGVQRRFTIRGQHQGIIIVDDYGHHPTEIRATLAGARVSYPGRRIWAILQPHRYTRLRDNLQGFVECTADADIAVVTEVYAAGESPIAGTSGSSLFEAMKRIRGEKTTLFLPNLENAVAQLVPRFEAGDVVITLGAGNITRLSHELAAAVGKLGNEP
jgi:UDP-N-acetylmuramate--alanine ligase